jgi:hypothetical protein
MPTSIQCITSGKATDFAEQSRNLLLPIITRDTTPPKARPTLFEVIGSMRSDGQPFPTRIYATRAQRVSAPRPCPACQQPFHGTGCAGRTGCKDDTDKHRVGTGHKAWQSHTDEGRPAVQQAHH